ncbi:hypothetical protein T05_9771 [Trichinella murrelli]|uniref:Uncharacterized protein n=1 Tax=Trichinella murrelli TaxID=144512 RepID=A0A0V0T4D7_9BILA|nr:hypothetical protein T05_9771 [Trichinella murrelli]
MGFPVAFGTDVAAALDLPSPVPSRSAAPGPAANAVYTLLPTLLVRSSGGRAPGQPVAAALCRTRFG